MYSQSDESETETDDNFDKRNGSEIYNLSEILSGSSSSHYELQQQPRHDYIASSEHSNHQKETTKEKRYYIYSHTKTFNDTEDDDASIKSRKIRSSILSERKQVSRNISMVLENLLKSYENSQLPTHGLGLCMDVLIKQRESGRKLLKKMKKKFCLVSVLIQTTLFCVELFFSDFHSLCLFKDEKRKKFSKHDNDEDFRFHL